MTGEITHKPDANGVLRQIVTPARLRQILDRDGDDYSKPVDFKDADEWRVEGEKEL